MQKMSNNNKIMSSQGDSSEDEGFYKPAIQITQPSPIVQTEFISIDPDFDDALDIVARQRPADYHPRFLCSDTAYHKADPYLQGQFSSVEGEPMLPLPPSTRNPKQAKKYQSLEHKYKNNPKYQRVYAKSPGRQQFASYIFSLEHTPDYNPNNYTTVGEDADEESIFDAGFESGNLLYAYRRVDSPGDEFDLIMQNDTNTKGYNQWFHFAVRNRDMKRVRINIVNFIKKKLMFVDGVRPVGFSAKLKQAQGLDWHFIGEKLTYGKSFISREVQSNPSLNKNYYTLSFQYQFQHSNDTVYMAYNFPYTYSKMINHIHSLHSRCPHDIEVKQSILCHSISNNPVPYLTIRHKEKFSRKTVLCLGRQHPGETVGSFVLEKFMDFVLGAPKLLQEYTFVVVPMVNPDGVIYGNFRTNLAGFDLNRQWKQPNRWLHPEVFFLSKLISSLENIEFCMDFHGHSKKMNCFIYACIDEKVTDFRLYPYIFSQKCDIFSIKDCTFTVTPDKIKTARINVFNQIHKPYIFTLETSFFGHSKDGKNRRFSIKDFQYIARGAIESLQALMCDKGALQKYEEEVRSKNYLFEQWAVQNKEDEGSQSNPEEGELDPVERKVKVMSDAAVKRVFKKLLKIKKPKPKHRDRSVRKKKEELSLLMKNKADSAASFQNRKKQKINPLNVDQEYGVIAPQQSRKKMKSQTRREIPKQIPIIATEPKVKSQPTALPPRSHPIKTMGPQVNPYSINSNPHKKQSSAPSSTTNSNLFDTAAYMRMREQISYEISKSSEQQPLRLGNFKRDLPATPVPEPDAKFSKTRAQRLKKQFEQLAPVYSEPKKKSRQKIYIIKQNKVVRSFTRINDSHIQRNIEKEVNAKTLALQNYQKMMSDFRIRGDNYFESKSMESQEPYRARKMLRPLDMRRHSNFPSSRQDEKEGVFFSFLGN